jgi:hypothetical protein
MDGANQPFTDADWDTIQIFCLVVLKAKETICVCIKW